MAEATTKDILKRTTPEQIADAYQKGKITAGSRNKILRAKARSTLEGTLEDEGMVKAILSRTLLHIQEGWENLKPSLTEVPSASPGEEAKRLGLALWGEIQILGSIFTAIGEVSGQKAENIALQMGAPSGLARVINFAVDVGSGFAIPTGKVAQGFALGVQGIQKFQKGKLAAKGAGLAAKAAAEEASVLTVIKEGITLDTTGKGVASKVKSVVGKLKKNPSIRDQFLFDLEKFHKEMSLLTETQTHTQTAAMASKLGLHRADLLNLVPGQALDEKQMLAYLKALEPLTDQWKLLAKEAVETQADDAVLSFLQYSSEFTTLSPIFRGAEITAGRSVEILKATPPMKALTDMVIGWDPNTIAKGDFVGAGLSMAEDVLRVLTQPEKGVPAAILAQSNWQQFQNKGWPMIREAYMNLLLPFAFIPSFVGNSIATGQHILERSAAAAFSIDKKSGVIVNEIPHFAKGLMLATGDALKAFGTAFKSLTPEEIGKLDYFPGAIPGALGHIIRTPTHGIVGMDNIFKTLLTRASYYAEAIRDGTHRGLTGTKLGNFVTRRVDYPTEVMQQTASEFATTNTFQNDLGKIGQTIRKGLQYGPGILYWPFMKSPIDLVKYAWGRMPGLQLFSKQLYDDIAVGGAKADLAIGRLTMSNLQAMFIFELAKEGFLTGSGPVDPALRAAWLATNEPYSVKTKDGWRPLTNMDPATTPIGIISDMTQVMDQLDEGTASQAAMAMTYVIMRNMVEKSWWTNATTVIDAIQGVAQGEPLSDAAKKLVMVPLVTVATGGPIGARLKNIMDPVTREAREWTDQITSKTVGYSKTMPPRRDAYGDPVTPPQPVGNSWFGLLSPLWPKEKGLTTDRVKLEGEKLQVEVPRFPDSIGGPTRDSFDIRAPFPEDRLGTGLSLQEKDRWQELYRKNLRGKETGIESQLLDNPEYQKQTRAAQREMFMDFMAGSRAMGREELLVEDVELGKRWLKSTATRILPMLQDEDRADAEQQINESLTLFEEMAPEMQENILRYGDVEPVETEGETE